MRCKEPRIDFLRKPIEKGRPMPNKKRLRIRLLIAGIVLVALVLAAAIVPSVIVKAQMKHGLKQHGEERVRIEDVDFNPFALRVTIHALLAEGPYSGVLRWQKAALSVSLWPLWHHRIIVDDLILRDAVVTVERLANGELRVGGIRVQAAQKGKAAPKAKRKKKPSPWEIGAKDIALSNVRISFRDPKITHDIVLDTLSLDRFESWRPNLSTHLFAVASAGGGTLTVKGRADPQGKERSVNVTITADSVAIGWLSPLLSGKGIAALDGTLNTDLTVKGISGKHGTYHGRVEGTAGLAGLRVSTSSGLDARTSLTLSGVLSGSRGAADTAASLGGEGTLRLTDVNASMTSPPVAARIPTATYQGRFTLSPSPLRVGGDITAASPAITTGDGKTLFGKASAVRVSEIALTGLSDLRVGEVRIDTVKGVRSELIPQSPARGPYVLSIDRLTLARGAVENKRHFRVGSLEITHAAAALVRDRSGDFVFPRLPAKAKPPKKPKPGPPAPPPTFALDTFVLDGASEILFLDRSVIPEARIELRTLAASLIGFNTSHLSNSAVFALHGVFNPYSELRITGRVTSLDSGGSGSAHARLDTFSLPLLTGYLRTFYGYRLNTGRFTTVFDGTVKQGALSATDSIHITALSAEALPNAPAYGKFSEKTFGLLSLGSALDIITKHNGDLNMAIPIAGDVKHPNFSVIGTLLQKSVANGIQGALATVFSAIGGFFTGNEGHPLRFKDVDFVPGSDSLSQNDKAYLDSMAGIMKDHPGVRIYVCGKATAADAAALSGTSPPLPIDSLKRADKQGLFLLARARARSVKNYLALKKGVSAKRLFLCAPEIDRAENARPRVELST